MRRRSLLAATALLPAVAAAQPAAEFPARSVRIIVPYGPGGSSDIVARILAQRATELSGQSFVVENRGGGAAIPGTQAVAAAPADGYTIGTADNALVVNPGLFRDRMPFDTERDLAPLGLAVTAPLLLLAHPTAPSQNLQAMLAEMRARPTGLSHGGIGTPTHLATVEFQLATKLEPTVVGYRGGGPQLTGLVAGDVPYGFVAISSAMSHVQAGRLRPLALTGPTRSPTLPAVPTMAEAGLAGWIRSAGGASSPPPAFRHRCGSGCTPCCWPRRGSRRSRHGWRAWDTASSPVMPPATGRRSGARSPSGGDRRAGRVAAGIGRIAPGRGHLGT
ncbi:tripartite tricarboxylate transporter substrate-binding protein [Siccirubricoccus deserti]